MSMTQPEQGAKEPPRHYPYVTRRLLHLFHAGDLNNVAGIDVEPNYGYTTRLHYKNGSHRITYGNDLGLNAAAACELANDKGHTKFILRTIGVACPKGREFLLPSWAERIRQSPHQAKNANIHVTDEANEYIAANLSYPVYVKPVSGSKGADIFKVYNADDLAAVFELFEEKKVRVAVVEEAINLPDYRIVTLDGELISAYQRIPLQVTGDGDHTIAELLTTLQERYEAEGRDTRIRLDDPQLLSHLGKLSLTLNSRPKADEAVVLSPVSNLSKGGTSVDVSKTIHPRWVKFASHVASNFNLRLCGLDLACEDITAFPSPHSVLEVNGSLGLDHYALSGESQQELVDRLYTKVLNTMG